MEIINKKRAFRETGVSAPIDSRLTDLLIELPTNEDKQITYYSTIEALIRAYGVKVNGSHQYDDTAWLNFSVLASEGIYAGREYDYDNESWKYYYSPPSDLHFQFKHYDNLTVKLFDLNDEDVLMIWSLYGRDWLFEFDLQPELHDTFNRPLMTQPSFTGKEWQGGKLQNLHKLVDGQERQPSDKQGQGRIIYSKHIAEYRIIPQSENLDKWVYHEELKPTQLERLARLDVNWKYQQLQKERINCNGKFPYKSSNRSKRAYADIKTGQRANRHNKGAFQPTSTTTSRSYKTTEKLANGSKQFNGYRFTVTGGNQLMYVPDKGQSFPIAKIRCEVYKDEKTYSSNIVSLLDLHTNASHEAIERYYLEWLPAYKRLTKEQCENAKRAIKPGVKRSTADTVINSNVESYRDNTMLYGVIQAEMRERADSVVVLPARKEVKPEYYSGRVFSFTNRNQYDSKFKELRKLGVSFTKVDRYTLIID